MDAICGSCHIRPAEGTVVGTYHDGTPMHASPACSICAEGQVGRGNSDGWSFRQTYFTQSVVARDVEDYQNQKMARGREMSRRYGDVNVIVDSDGNIVCPKDHRWGEVDGGWGWVADGCGHRYGRAASEIIAAAYF